MEIKGKEKILAGIAAVVVFGLIGNGLANLFGGENVDLDGTPVTVVTSQAAVSVFEAMAIPETEVEAALDNSGATQQTLEQELVLVSSSGIIIPLESIVYKEGKQIVVVVEDDDVPVYREVETGKRTKERVEILKGLEEGEEYIIEGQLYVKEDSILVIKEPEL